MESTSLEMGLIALVVTFKKYAGEGRQQTLNKAELKNLLASELPHLMAKGGDQVDEVIDMLDKDADGSLDFQEYFTLVASLAMSVHAALENH